MRAKFDLSFLVKIQVVVMVIFITVLSIQTSFFKKKLAHSQKENRGYKRFIESHKRESLSVEAKASFAKIALPEKLKHLPLGEEDQIVLGTKKITIRNIAAPYNPSIIKSDNGYLMFFRYDTHIRNEFSSFIGSVKLDKDFNQTNEEYVTINTFNKNSEDPRIFQVGDKAYITYSKSDFSKQYEVTPATINIANIDLANHKVKYTTELDLNLSIVEKNWIPFEYITPQGKPEIFFQYSLNPHKILHLPDPKTNHFIHPIFPKDDIFHAIHWIKNTWGTLRGGTPALKVGNDYLGFFHTSFYEEDQIWYVMGAYTFEGEPPFRINSISRYPILFSGIYDSVALNTAEAKKRVIFPSGFVIEKQGDKELIHVSCGENDSGIKIITLDKKALLKHLQKI